MLILVIFDATFIDYLNESNEDGDRKHHDSLILVI